MQSGSFLKSQFFKVVVQFILPSAMCQFLSIFRIFNLSHPFTIKYLTMVLVCIFLIVDEVEQFFMGLLTICISFFLGEVSHIHLKFVFLLTELQSSLYILGCKQFVRYMYLNILFYYVACLLFYQNLFKSRNLKFLIKLVYCVFSYVIVLFN